MNRNLALILLILLGLTLLHSLYSFYHGRFGEAMIMYPLLVVVYLVFIGTGKWKVNSGERPPEPTDDQTGSREKHPVEKRDEEQFRP